MVGAEIWLLLDSRGLGGIESHVIALATGLREAGQAARVVFLEDHGPHPMRETLMARRIPLTALEGGAPGLVRALRRRRPAILHTHGYKAGILGRLVAPLFRVPVVSTYHAGEPGKGRVRLYNAIDRLTARLAQPIAVSAPIALNLSSTARVIENFVTVPPFDRATREREPRIAFVGRLSHEKGPDRFCELARRLPDLDFEVYGDGPQRKDLETGYGEGVTFHGAIDHMSSAWRRIDLLCMTSRHEGLPMAALEAMAHGVPVAAFAVGGLPDLIEHGVTGFLAPPGNLDRLAAEIAIWQRLPEAKRSAMSCRAREAIARRYSTEIGVAKVVQVYEQALGARIL